MIGEHLIAENNIGGLDLQSEPVDFVVVSGGRVRLKDATLSIEQSLQVRAIARLGIVDLDGTLSYRPGMRVAIAIEDRLRFAGTVDEVEIAVPGEGPHRHFLLNCVDWNQLADRFLVAEAFEEPGQTTGDIVRSLVTRFLAAENVTLDGIKDGVAISSARWQFVKLSSVLDELARETNYVWTITPERVMRFFPREDMVAGWTLTEDARAFIELVSLRSREGYRNRQFLVGASDTQASPVVESFRGNSSTRTFTVARPVAQIIDIRVNGLAQNYGVLNVDQDSEWYFRRGEKTITQDTDLTPLTEGEILDVEYKGLIPVITRKDLREEQGQMAALEGGSGIYEEAEEDDRIDNLQLAEARLTAILDRQGKELNRIRFSTARRFLDAGMIQHVNLPTWGVEGDYLIESVSIRDIGGYNLRTFVDAISSGQVGTVNDFYRRLFTAGRTFAIRPDEIIQSLDIVGSEIALTDSLLVQDGIRPGSAADDPYTFWIFGTARVGISIIGSPTYLDVEEPPEDTDEFATLIRRGSTRRAMAS